MSENLATRVAPHPMPGWVRITRTLEEPQREPIQIFNQPGQQPTIKMPAAIATGIVEEIGDNTDEFYEEYGTDAHRLIVPYTLSSKVWFLEDHALPLGDHLYIRWDHVISYNND